MNSIRRVLSDRRRSQRGSILSGVLIIVMFLSIISGALMTELTTNFLLSHALVTRVNNQATVNSALELALDRLQNSHSPLNSACPNLPSANVNNQVAVATYISCALVVDSASAPAVKQLLTSAPFKVDGTYANLSDLPGGDEYLVADSNGTLFAIPFGQTSGWSRSLDGIPTAPPLAMAGGGGEISDLVPIRYSNPTSYAVALLEEDNPGQRPSFNCNMAADAAVTAGASASRNARRTVYFGDGLGTVFAYDGTANANCSLGESVLISGGQPVVAGPVVFEGSGSRTDDLYVIVSDNASSEMVRFTYNSNNRNLSLVSRMPLPYPSAVGMAALSDDTAGTVPARIAITYAGGQVSVVKVNSSYTMSLLAGTGLVPGGGVTSAPGWCQPCLAGAGVVGVGGQGGLYLFDSSLNLNGTFAGAAIRTPPVADDGGDWFIAGDDGILNEVQRPAGQSTMVLAKSFPAATAAISSSPVMQPCGSSLCIYFASMDSSIYLVPLNAREATLSACITNLPPGCSGDNPRLWARVEVGSASDPKRVRVQGWSYYSP